MSKLLKVPESELEVIRQKIKHAREDAEKQREIRKKAHDAYYRLPLGNEKEGRSRVIDTAVFNHISGLHPHLMRRFLQNDLKITIKGPNELQAKALKQRIRDDLHDQGGFTLIDDVLKDGEIYHNGTAKMWWNRVWGEEDKRQVIVDEEQLRQLAEDPRFSFEQSDVFVLPVRKAEVNDGIPTAESPDGTIIEIEGKQLYAVNVTFTDLEESGPIIATMPPEEFIVERGKSRINDRYGVGHVRTMLAGELQRENDRRTTVDEDGKRVPYYTNLKVAVDKASPTNSSREMQERQEREDLAFVAAMPITGEALRKPVEVIEWCDYVVCADEDDEKGGELEPAFLTFVGDELVRAEENEDGIIPYSTWSPTPNTHSVIGTSIAAVHADDQNVRTVITRALLDNVAFSIDKPRFIRNRGVDLLGLQNLTPGKLLHGNPEDVTALDMGELNPHMLKVLEYLKAEGEERGPSTRLNQGVDSGPGGNDTATGISIVQRASFSKIDLIAMAFTELFLVDLYNKLIILYQKNLDLPVVVKVDGEEVTLTRKSLQGRYVAYADMGAELDFDDRAFQRANVTLTMMTQLAQGGVYPFAPSAIREAIKDVFVAAGRIDPAKYLEMVQMPAPQGPPGALPGAATPPGAPPGPPGGPPQPPPGTQPPPVNPVPGRATPGDQTLAGGAADPAAGMGAGQ